MNNRRIFRRVDIILAILFGALIVLKIYQINDKSDLTYKLRIDRQSYDSDSIYVLQIYLKEIDKWASLYTSNDLAETTMKLGQYNERLNRDE